MDRVDLPPKFVIPGGTELSARLDVARTSVRRAERRVASSSWPASCADDTILHLPEPGLRRVYAMARYADEDDPELFEGRSESDRAPRQRQLEHDVEIREHRLMADEPQRLGGERRGPSPQELLAASLASCTAITMEMYAERKGWDIGEVVVDVDYEPAQRGSPTKFEMDVKLPKELPEDQREKLMQIAAKCPVHRTLEGEVMFDERVDWSSPLVRSAPHISTPPASRRRETLVDRPPERGPCAAFSSALAALRAVGERVRQLPTAAPARLAAGRRAQVTVVALRSTAFPPLLSDEDGHALTTTAVRASAAGPRLHASPACARDAAGRGRMVWGGRRRPRSWRTRGERQVTAWPTRSPLDR